MSDAVYYKKCEKCGYETGKCRRPEEGNKRCWKCGSFIYRDYRIKGGRELMNTPQKPPEPISTDESRSLGLHNLNQAALIVELEDRLASQQQSMETLTRNNLNMEKTIMESDHLSYVFGLEQSMEKVRVILEVYQGGISLHGRSGLYSAIKEALKELEQKK